MKNIRFGLLVLAVLLVSMSAPSDTGSIGGESQLLWYYDLNAPSFGSGAAADIDGDGYLEIVFGTYFNDEYIYALNAEDGSVHWTYDTGGCNDASPVIDDVDLDGELEVVIPSSSRCMVYCFDGATGDVEWTRSTGSNSIDSPPAVADVDNDDRPEIIFGAFYGYVYCLNGEDGSVFWQTNLGTDSYIQSGPDILDCDGDGQLDVVVAQWAGDCRVYALKGDDATVLWYSDIPGDYMYHGGSFADVDGDGRPEIAIGCYDNYVYLLNADDGSLEWSYRCTYYVGSPTSIADLDNDGHLEVVFASYNRLGVLSHTGGLLWSQTTGGTIFRGAAVEDMDGDGILDVVFGSDDGVLRILRGSDGHVLHSFDLESHYGRTFQIDNAPVIGDFDNDGDLDVFVVGGYGTYPPGDNHGRAYALSPDDGTGPGWPMFRHDRRHSACYSSSLSAVDIDIVAADPPVIIPATGGSFDYRVDITNGEESARTFDAWIMATLPNGNPYGPVVGPVRLTLGGGGSAGTDRTQNVPARAPAGTYRYTSCVGIYPGEVWDSDYFTVEKLIGK